MKCAAEDGGIGNGAVRAVEPQTVFKEVNKCHVEMEPARTARGRQAAEAKDPAVAISLRAAEAGSVGVPVKAENAAAEEAEARVKAASEVETGPATPRVADPTTRQDRRRLKSLLRVSGR